MRKSVLWTCLVATGGLGNAAWAQDAAPVPTTMPASTDPAVVEQKTYKDNLLDADVVKRLDKEENISVYNPDGRARQLNVEAIFGRTSHNNEATTEYGVAADGYIETDQWGVWSIDGTLATGDGYDRRQSSNGLRQRITVWQRNFHLPHHWRMDNGFGVVHTLSNDLMRDQYRFYFPAMPVVGASLTATQADKQWMLQSSYGRAGVYNGARLSGFETTSGSIGTISAQHQITPHWTVAAAALRTNGQVLREQLLDPRLGNEQPLSSQATYVGARWKGAHDQFQINAVHSRNDVVDNNVVRQYAASGVWMDGRSERNRTIHNYGVFYLRPQLSWGALPINNDVQGGYYRISQQYSRWLWNAGIDRIDALSGKSFTGTYVTSFARYQASSVLGYGGSMNIRQGKHETAYTSQLFVDRKNRLGQSRVQLEQAGTHGDNDNTSWQLTLDHAWPTKTGSNISTAVSYGQWAADDRQQEDTWTVSVNGSKALGAKWAIDGVARIYRSQGNGARQGNDINMSLSYHATSRWTALLSVFEARGRVRSPFIIDPLYQDDPTLTSADRSVFLSLRYNAQAGSSTQVLGGAPSSASGRIAGSVFLDNNNDGRLNADEVGAANITVVLDGLYTTQTDAAGQYQFEHVAIGAHRVQFVADGLELPWGFDEALNNKQVDVSVRRTSTADMPAMRPR